MFLDDRWTRGRPCVGDLSDRLNEQDVCSSIVAPQRYPPGHSGGKATARLSKASHMAPRAVHTSDQPVTGRSMCFSSDGTLAATGCDDTAVRVFEVEPQHALAHTLRGHAGYVYCVRFLPHSTRLLSCSGDTTIRMWDAASGTALCVLEGHAGSVFSLCLPPSAAYCVSTSLDGRVGLWDLDHCSLRGAGEEIVQQVPVLPASRFLFSTEGDGGWVLSAAVDSGGSIVTSSMSCVLSLWSLPGGLKGRARLWEVTAPSPSSSLQFHNTPGTEGQDCVLAVDYDSRIRMWLVKGGDFQVREVVLFGPSKCPVEGPPGVMAAALSACGQHLYCGFSTGALKSYSMEEVSSCDGLFEGTMAHQLLSGQDGVPVRSIATSPSGGALAVVLDSGKVAFFED